MRSDPAHPRTDREGHFHHVVERGLVGGIAERAIVLVAFHRLERGTRVKHAAAAGTQDVPRQFEQAEPGGVQERGDRAFLVESTLGGEGERVDAAQLAIKPALHQIFDGGDTIRIGRLPQDTKQGFGFAHRRNSFKPQ